MATKLIQAVPLVLAGIGIAMPAAFAADEQKSETAEVRIEAARTVERVGRSSTTGAPIEIVQLTRRVSFADLDLSTNVGALELETRIKETAREACRQLDTLYPISTSEGKGTKGLNCVDDAIDDAMTQAKAAIADAKQRMERTRSAESPGT